MQIKQNLSAKIRGAIMKIKKFKNSLHLKLDKGTEFDFNDDDLFWNDLYIETSDGWLYLLDTNRNKVVPLNNYGWDAIRELNEGKTVILSYWDNDPEYEFNQQ